MNDSAFRFGDFRLFPARRELWRDGRLLTIQPKVLETLTYLVQHRDRAVGRDELISAVWGRVDIADNVLSQIVRRARQMVGDTSEAQDAIRTVPRFGYRWIRHVDVAPADACRQDETAAAPADERSASQPTPPARPVRIEQRSRWSAPAATLMLLLVAAVAAVAAVAGWSGTDFLAAGGQRATATTLSADQAPRSPPTDPLTAIRDALAVNQLDVARALFRHLPDEERLRPELRHAEAELAVKEGRFDAAVTGFTSLLADLERDGGDPLLAGKAAHGIGRTEFVRRNYDTAIRHYERAVELYRAAPGPEAESALGHALTGLGGVHTVRYAFDDAERAYAQSRTVLERVGDPAALGRLDMNVGSMLLHRHRPAEALPRFQRAAELTGSAGDTLTEAMSRINLVNTHLALLQPAEALAEEPRLRELRERIGDPVLAAHVELARANAFTANGRLDDAERVLRVEAGRPTPDAPGMAASRDLAAAELAFARGALDAGAERVQSALASPWYAPERRSTAYARWRLLTARQALGDLDGVVAAAADAQAQSRARPDLPRIALYAALARGEAAAAQGDELQARAAFDRALAQAEADRVPFDLMQSVAGYARFLLRNGDTTGATAVIERIADWVDVDFTASLAQLGVLHAIGSPEWRPALARTQRLAGERTIPTGLTTPPGRPRVADDRKLIAQHPR